MREPGQPAARARHRAALPTATITAPGMEKEFPPEAMAYFGAQTFGWNLLGVMAGTGGLMMLAGSWLRGMREGGY